MRYCGATDLSTPVSAMIKLWQNMLFLWQTSTSYNQIIIHQGEANTNIKFKVKEKLFRISPKAWEEKMASESVNPQVSISEAKENGIVLNEEEEESLDKSCLNEEMNNGLSESSVNHHLLTVFQ